MVHVFHATKSALSVIQKKFVIAANLEIIIKIIHAFIAKKSVLPAIRRNLVKHAIPDFI